MEDEIEKFLEENCECFDRFTFDRIFRFLLEKGASHKEAKDYILFNCSLSLIIFQERIDNGYYKKIKVNEKVSEDLLKLQNDIFNEKKPKHFLN